MKLLLGDCLESMRKLEPNSIDSIVTDPPYGIRFMGKSWDGADIEKMAKKAIGKEPRLCSDGRMRKPRENNLSIAAGKYDLTPDGMKAFEYFSQQWAVEAFRVLKPGGHLLSFASPRTYHRMACGIESAGFEIRDQVMWLFGQGFPKSLNVEKATGDKRFKGIGTALKPANEPICLARKPLEGTVAKNTLKWGVGGINVDATRIGVDEKDPNKRKSTGGYIKQDSEATVPNAPFNKQRNATLTTGRFPSNVILDEVAAEMLDEQTGISKPKLGRTGKRGGKGFGLFDDAKSANETGTWPSDPGGGASRFFYVAKASKRERNAGLNVKSPDISDEASSDSLGTSRCVIPQTNHNHHPTVKPIKLMTYLIRLITPPGGVVLDPFMGSGSTGVAAVKDGFRFIGCELNEEYLTIAKKRIEAA